MLFTKFPFERSGEHCFFLQSGLFGKKAAEKFCEKHFGASLYEIHSWQDQREMEKFLKNKRVKTAVWLGGEVSFSFFRQALLTFRWNSKFLPALENFRYPLSEKNHQGNCVVMSPAHNYRWERSVCVSKRVSICALKANKDWLNHDKRKLRQRMIVL
jgi:hypothetical protein